MAYNLTLTQFKEALEKQQFEACQGLLDYAKKQGAQQEEIDTIIAAYLNGGIKVKNRIRHLTTAAKAKE